MINNAPNKSLHQSAPAAALIKTLHVKSKLVAGGFALGELRRSMPRYKLDDQLKPIKTMLTIKQFRHIVASILTLLILLPNCTWSQQSLSLDSTAWFLKPQDKKDKSNSLVIFFLKNNEACVMFQNPKGNALGLLPVRMGKRPVWKQNGNEYQIKFRDRSFTISGKLETDNSITAVTKGEDNLLESKKGFIGESLKDPKPAFDSRNFLVPFTWLTALPNGKPKWASEIKTEGLDLCNPLEDPSKQSPWFP